MSQKSIDAAHPAFEGIQAVKKGIAESFEKYEPSLTKEFIDTIIKKGAVK